MHEAVYILCALTSTLCAVLLLRNWLRSRTRLLLWSSLCFVGLALNNVALVLDRMVVMGTDLWFLRTGTALVALLILVIGLVWDGQ